MALVIGRKECKIDTRANQVVRKVTHVPINNVHNPSYISQNNTINTAVQMQKVRHFTRCLPSHTKQTSLLTFKPKVNYHTSSLFPKQICHPSPYLVLLARNVGNDVVGNVHCAHTWVTRPADGLHRHDRAVRQPQSVRQRLERHHEARRRAVGIAHNEPCSSASNDVTQ